MKLLKKVEKRARLHPLYTSFDLKSFHFQRDSLVFICFESVSKLFTIIIIIIHQL